MSLSCWRLGLSISPMATLRNVSLALCIGATLAGNIKEYVALGPNAGQSGNTTLEWVAVEYPEGVSSAGDVTLSEVTKSVPELGGWYGLDTGGLALTAKIVGDTMYALYDKSGDGSGGGCCADTLRIYKRDSPAHFKSISLSPLVQGAMNVTDAHASHTFDVTTLKDGTLAALFQVKYLESGTGGDYADAIVGMKISDGSLLKTASGASSFNMFKEVGTMSDTSKESRFKIQYYKDSSTSGGGGEQFHGNGVLRFTSKAGTTLLAFTHRMDAEAIIFKDPFTYSIAEGGGKILQRFGTPFLYNQNDYSYRYFGLKSSASAFVSGVHNVFYTASSASLGGKESISLFVNAQDSKSAAYEFELNPVEEGSKADTGDDTVFNVDYVFAKCTFQAQAQGGARTIGNGVFLVMSGADSSGLEVVDTSGKSKTQKYTLGGTRALYDPFIRVMATGSQASSAIIV